MEEKDVALFLDNMLVYWCDDCCLHFAIYANMASQHFDCPYCADDSCVVIPCVEET